MINALLQKKTKKSFRDPSGYVFETEGKIFRVVKSSHRILLSLLETSKVIQKKIASEEVIAYEVLKTKENILLEHPKIWFPSYPYEWSYSMLRDAAELTNHLSIELLKENLGLQDATPSNILFQGPKPIFIDIASIIKREEGDAIWRPYGQFLRTFLLPLLMNKEFDLKLTDIFLARSDGLLPDDCLAFGKWWKKNIFSLVCLPVFLTKFSKTSIYQKKELKNKELARFILERRFKMNAKILRRLQSPKTASHWSFYYKSNLSHYSDESFSRKEQFVQQVLQEKNPMTVLDVGCNTGCFSKMAAQRKAKVVAIDYDSDVIERLYQEAKQENLNILPLVVNISRPSPALGWNNQETWSFLQRAQKKFDLVLMLAVIHHMTVTDRIPMEQIVEMVEQLTTKWVLIEFVDPKDPMFITLERGRDLYQHLTFEYFRSCFEKYFIFERVSAKDYHPTRHLVLLKKKNLE